MKPGPWTKEFDETGGYDCMYGAWTIKDSAGETVVVVDQRHYGQNSCDWDFRSHEAEEIARLIVSTGQSRSLLARAADLLGTNEDSAGDAIELEKEIRSTLAEGQSR